MKMVMWISSIKTAKSNALETARAARCLQARGFVESGNVSDQRELIDSLVFMHPQFVIEDPAVELTHEYPLRLFNPELATRVHDQSGFNNSNSTIM